MSVDPERMAVALVEVLDAAGLNYEVFRSTTMRVSLEDAGLITTQLLGARATGGTGCDH